MLAHPEGISSGQVAELLGIPVVNVSYHLRLELHTRVTRTGQTTNARWWPLATSVVAKPSPPARAEESLSNGEPAPAGGVAAQPELEGSGVEASPRASASSAGAPGPRQPEPAGEPPAPVTGSPAEPPPVSSPSVAAASTAEPPGGERMREGDRPGSAALNASLFDRVLRQVEQLEDLRAELVDVQRDLEGQLTRADDLEVDVRSVGETLDRLGVPAGDLAWRLGWVEGRSVRT